MLYHRLIDKTLSTPRVRQILEEMEARRPDFSLLKRQRDEILGLLPPRPSVPPSRVARHVGGRLTAIDGQARAELPEPLRGEVERIAGGLGQQGVTAVIVLVRDEFTGEIEANA